MNNYKFSDKINEFIKDSTLEQITIGCSDTLVFKISSNNNNYFLKTGKYGSLTKEYNKLRWLDGKLDVPKVILYDIDNGYEYLLTTEARGEMICVEKYKKNPLKSLEVLKDAFGNIYKVDISDCPFDTSIDYKLSLVKYNIDNGLINEDNINKDLLDKFGSVDNIYDYLVNNKFYDDTCFSHGDTSLPNIFADNFKFSSFIDVGECGVADKWFDLAICEKSIRRNYGEEYVDMFYKVLNIKPNREKIEYYLIMMELYL